MLLSRRCVESVGPWDESFFLYEEEVDFALRAADAGFELRLQPAATAVRLIGNAEPSDKIWTLSRINKLRLYGRRSSAMRTLGFWLALLLAELLRCFKGSTRHRAAFLHLLLPFRFLDQVIRDHLLREPSVVKTPAGDS